MTDFRIEVIVDPKGTDSGTKTVERRLGRLENAADRVRRSIGRALGTLAGGALLTGGVRVLAQYEQQLSTVRAVTGATQQQFAALNEEALRLGANTRFSASQAAEGLTFLARAGFSAEQASSSLEGTLRLAQAGALGLGRAADIASNVLTAFRLNVDQIDRVGDVLAFTANNANTNVNQLGDAFRFVAPVAASFSVSLEETAAAIGVLSNAGLQASTAGTGLRKILSELESPAQKTRDILRSYGITADEVRISSVGLTTAIQRLADAGVDGGVALEIFGDRGGPAFETLRNSVGDVRDFTESLGESAGTAQRIADVMDDNLNGALLSVASAFESVILRLGQLDSDGALTGFVRGVATGLRFVADNIEDVTRVAGVLSAALITKLAIGGFGTLITKMVPATVGMNAFSAATLVASKATAGLNALLLRNPIGVAVLAISAAVAGLIEFAARTGDAGEEVFTLGDKASVVLGLLTDGFSAVGQFVGSAADSVVDFAKRLVVIPQTIAEVVNRSIGLFVGLVRAVASVVNDIISSFRAIGETGSRILSIVAQVGKGDFSGATEGFNALGQDIVGGFDEIGSNAAKQFAIGFNADTVGALGDLIASGAEAAVDLVEPIFTGITDNFRDRLVRAAAERRARQNEGATATGSPQGIVEEATVSAAQGIPADIAQVLKELEREAEILTLSNRERDIRNNLIGIEESLASTLTPALKERIELQLRENQLLAIRAQVIDDLTGPEQDLAERQRVLNQLSREGVDVQRDLIDLQIEQAALAQNRALGFDEGFLTEINSQLADLRLSFTDFGSELASIFGPQGTLVTGISNAAAEAVVFGKSFEDALAGIGKQIAVQILGKLIEIGIQSLLNYTLGQSLSAAATASSVAQAGALSAAWATPAALASLASFGTNAAPAGAAIASTVALSQGIAQLSQAASFANGGFVGGRGSNRSDSILANLSAGEFVMNQRATSQFLPMLESMNRGTIGTGSTDRSDRRAITFAPHIQVDGGNIDEQKLVDMMEENFNVFLGNSQRVGGALER